MQPNLNHLDMLIRHIVEVADPLRIILFGSAARGEMRVDSDFDVLVIMPDGTHRLNTALDLYRKTASLGFPADIVVTTPAVLERRKNSTGYIYKAALAEGRDVYVRAA
jgi:predicted nucleotidyltransferase